jgi:predicted secreted protein
LHIHLIANRIEIDRKVYKTDFVSNHSAHAAEENTIAEAAINVIVEVASNTISTAGEVASAIGGLFDMSSSGEDSAESEFQYQLKKDKLK